MTRTPAVPWGTKNVFFDKLLIEAGNSNGYDSSALFNAAVPTMGALPLLQVLRRLALTVTKETGGGAATAIGQWDWFVVKAYICWDLDSLERVSKYLILDVCSHF